MPNHFDSCHPELVVGSTERNHWLAEARQRSLQETQALESTLAENMLSVTTGTVHAPLPEAKNTRSWPSFPKEHLELLEFRRYLQSLDGKLRSRDVADSISMDVSKYLYYANPKVLNWAALLNKQKIEQYISHLETSGACGIDGRVQKLERICSALDFVADVKYSSSEDYLAISRVKECILTKWMKPLRKQRKKKQVSRLVERSNRSDGPTFDDVTQIVECEAMWRFFQETVDNAVMGEAIPDKDLETAMGAALTLLVLPSWQRPGAGTGCTIEEWHNRVKHPDCSIMTVVEHKTGHMGPATLQITNANVGKMEMYVTHLRPLLLKGKGKAKAHKSDKLFIKSLGRDVTNVNNIITSLGKRFGFKPISCTEVRRMGATQTAKRGSTLDMDGVLKQLHHTPHTSKLHYQATLGTEQSAKSFNFQESLRTGDHSHDDVVATEPPTTNTTGTPDTANSAGCKQRRFFTPEQSQQIFEYFKHNIQNEQYTTVERCAEFLNEHPGMQRNPKDIYDKVKNFVKKSKGSRHKN